MASKTVIFIIIIIVIVLLFALISMLIFIILKLRKKKEVDEFADEETEEDEEAVALQKVIVEKTPLGTKESQIIDDDSETLLVCKLGAESQKYDQDFLWRKYKKTIKDTESSECSLKHGSVKLEFYHQSYSQVLHMKILHATGLKSHDSNKELSTRVKILLITPLKTRHITRRTRVVEKSNNPEFNEVLVIKLTRKTTRDSTVEVSVWSIDDFYKESLIGGCKINLKDYDVSQRNTIEKELQIEFEEHENPGYVMISLAYDKEQEKLTVIIMRGKLLKCAAHEDTLLQETINPYVKAYLFCNKKRIKKDKTDTKRDQINPVFNSVMEFFLPQSIVDQTNIVFVVMHKDVRTDSKENIGRIEIGSDSSEECLSHWKKVMEAHGKPVAQWHQLWY